MNLKTIVSLALVSSAIFGQCQAVITQSGYGSGVSPAPFLGGSAAVYPGTGVGVFLPTPQSGFNLILPNTTDWTPYTHLQVRMQNMGAKAEPFFLAVASTGLWVYTEVVLYPGADQTVIIPLDNSAVLGQYRLPQPPTSTAYQLAAGSSADKPNVRWLCVRAPNESAGTSLLIRDMRPISAPVPSANLVDAYGQQNLITWPGKIASDADLTTSLQGRTISGVFPYPADIYGGVTGTGTSGNGRWRTTKINGVWYILDPLGNRFFSAGVAHAGGPIPAIVSGRESAFAPGALPSQTGPFAAHYRVEPGTGMLTYNFFTSNLQRRVGAQWQTTLMDETKARMKSWAFNTAAVGSSDDFRLASSQTTYTVSASVNGAFAWIQDAEGIPMPDVFDPAWSAAVQTTLAAQIATIRNPAFNMGMFVDNELPWARSYTSANYRFGLCDDILKSPATQPAKNAFVQWLAGRYGNSIAALDAAWGMNFSSFADILSAQTAVPSTPTAAMQADMNAFTLTFARTYFGTIRKKLSLLGYQGLYLGCRFLNWTPEALQACTEVCDVVSYNCYESGPWKNHDDFRALDAPVMISETGFGACDRGREPFWPNLVTENDRAAFIRDYYSQALTWPNLVGIHWYKWEDDVVSGRYYDGNNCCLGLVSITDVPYWPTVDALTSANVAFEKRLMNPTN